MRKEKWVDIREFEGIYRISNKGRIRSLRGKSPKFIKLNSICDGYIQVTLYRGWLHVTRKVHILVALHFVPNPHNKPTVNHIDEIKAHNWDTNLEWATYKEQMIHSSAKKVIQKTLKGKKIKIWESVRSTKGGGFDYKNVSACCRGLRKTHKGFIWEFK